MLRVRSHAPDDGGTLVRVEMEYVGLMDVKYDWKEKLAKYDVDTVLLPVNAALASAMKESSRWHVVYDDGLAIVFRLANEADDAYMGFATREEVAAFLNELLEAERAGTGVALKSAESATGTKFVDLLRDVHKDEARWCAMLLKQLKVLGAPASTKIGAFQDKALAIEGLPERMAFLNRGQGWVVKKLREMLPKVRDDALHRDLAEMLQSHEVNIARTNEALKA